ncbi:peptide-methionine (S)-S-oxide reductase MsrA [uncultured Brevundimonas sp.]|uniref:peptide-methionine (S)-S-oxide reductase MsrA n=1 Tax=uncultured Brevundimonas sp. TaxID=213418 RepID=UPI0030ECB8D3|tara:strand:- start:123 stop:731 length:609 start_codon:yes stop_codon:yes gene_type:complete
MRLMFSLIALLLLTACAGSETRERLRPEMTATAVFAAGCFWCAEQAFEQTPGVVEAVSGYTGGTTNNPTYEQVTRGGTGHYEAVRVVYDPTVIGYEQLLDVFWKNVDPFDATGQFCDKGPSYRGAIFPATPEETAAAEASKQAVARQFNRAVEVRIVPSARFYDAETYHQDYYLKNPQTYAFYKWRCGRAQRLEAVWGPHEE